MSHKISRHKSFEQKDLQAPPQSRYGSRKNEGGVAGAGAGSATAAAAGSTAVAGSAAAADGRGGAPAREFRSMLSLRQVNGEGHGTGDSGNGGGSGASAAVTAASMQEFRRLVEPDGFWKEHCTALCEMRRRGELCDAELRAGDARWRCHRLVLSSGSRYFRALFASVGSSGGGAEAGSKQSAAAPLSAVAIVDLGPELDGAAVGALVDFCYTGRIVISLDNAQAILLAATSLQFDGVAHECGELLCSSLQPSSCVQLRRYAERHGRADLLRLADGYLIEHFQRVAECDGAFHELPLRTLLDALASPLLNVDSEERVYEAVMKWVRGGGGGPADSDEGGGRARRAAHLATLLRLVKLPLLPAPYLLQTVEQDELVRRDLECRDLLDEAKHHQLVLAGFAPKVRLSERIMPRKSYSGVLFCIGGRGTDGDPYKSIECYDLRKDTWFPVTEMSTARRHVGVIFAVGKLYAIGGHDGKEHLSYGEVFDPLTNKWAAIAPMRIPRRGLALAGLGGAIYAIGGLDDSVCFNTVERYDPSLDVWTTVADMNIARGGVGVGTIKGCTYAVGGNDGLSSLSQCEQYDAILNKWVMVASMNKRRAGAGVCILNGYLYVAGGFDDSAPLESCERYETSTNQWTYINRMTCPRGGVGVAALGGLIYAVGGHDGTNYLNAVEAYNPLTDCWSRVCPIAHYRAGVGLAAAPEVSSATIANMHRSSCQPASF